MLDQNYFNMMAHLAICRHGPLLKIVSKTYYIILVKTSAFTKYDLALIISVCGPRLIIVSNSYYVLSASKLVGPNTITIRGPFNHLSLGQF